MYRETIEQTALPMEELTALAEANTAPTMAEMVMRVRAVAELSRNASTETLMALASIAARRPAKFAEVIAALGKPAN